MDWELTSYNTYHSKGLSQLLGYGMQLFFFLIDNRNTYAYTTLTLYKWRIEPTPFRDVDQGRGYTRTHFVLIWDLTDFFIRPNKITSTQWPTLPNHYRLHWIGLIFRVAMGWVGLGTWVGDISIQESWVELKKYYKPNPCTPKV